MSNKNNRSARNKNKNKNRKNIKINKNSAPPYVLRLGAQTIPRLIMPDSILVPLKFTDITTSRTNAAAVYCSWRFRMNDCYDPDPLIGSGAVPAFVEWAGFFGLFRVMRFHYTIAMSGLDNIPGILHSGPSITDLGANYANIYELESETPYGRTSSFGALSAGQIARVQGSIDLPEFVGNLTYMGDDAYGSLTSTSPASRVFFNVGFTTPTAMTSGVFYSLVITYEVNFYGRKNLAS
jgi:hypothetical protein